MVTPTNILARLRASRNLYALSFMAVGSLIYSGAVPRVCEQCCGEPEYAIQSHQDSSVADEPAEQEEVAGHSHGDHHHNFPARSEGKDRHSDISGLTVNENELQNENQQSSEKTRSCVCDSHEESPLSNQQFCSIILARKSDFAKDSNLRPEVISIKSADLQIASELIFLRCHSPTPQLNCPTPLSGFGNQQLLC